MFLCGGLGSANDAAFHEGIDIWIDGQGGQVVRAARDGQLYRARPNLNLVVIQVPLAGGTFEYDTYSHIQLRAGLPAEGSSINQGFELGTISITEMPAGVRHLHFGVLREYWNTATRLPYLNPFTRFNSAKDVDPLEHSPRVSDVNNDNRRLFVAASGTNTSLAGAAKGDVDILADVYDRMNESFLVAAAPLSVSYTVRPLFRGTHGVRTVADPYVLAKFDDSWFTEFDGATIAAQEADARAKTRLVYATTVRGVSAPGPLGEVVKSLTFQLTNTKGITGAPNNVADQYWRTDALDDGLVDTNEHANYFDRPQAVRNFTARFRDGEYLIWVNADDVSGKTASQQFLRLGSVTVANFFRAAQPRQGAGAAQAPIGVAQPLYAANLSEDYERLTTPMPSVAASSLTFQLGEIVAVGDALETNYYPNELMAVYVVPHRIWNQGDSLSSTAVHHSLVLSDAEGTIPLTQVWQAAQTGKFDLIVDYDNDGKFSWKLDGLSAFTVAPTSPYLAINDAGAPTVEGNSGATALTFDVTLSMPQYSNSVTVNYATADGIGLSAASTADNDYSSANGVVTFQPGEIIKHITVSLNGDTKFERDEHFLVNLSNPTGAVIGVGQGIGTIVNDDSEPPLISINDVSLTEGLSGPKSFNFTVSLSAPSTQTVSVNFATADDTAVAGNDYTSSTGTVTFIPGDTTKIITVDVNGDNNYEANETFFVNLTNPINAEIGDGQGLGTIVNDDTNSPPVAQDDRAVTAVNTPVTITVLANDSDPDNDPLTVTSAGPASFGTVVINPNNTVTYTPNAGFEGPEGFMYEISDGRGGSAFALVSLFIGQPQLFDGEGDGTPSAPAILTAGQLQPVVEEAVALLRAAGFDVGGLGQAIFLIDDLYGPLLGVTHETTIWIDKNAAGYGWYIEEVSGGVANGGPFAGVHLLTVVTHELGHVLGFDSIDPAIQANDWMTATLASGVRRLPTVPLSAEVVDGIFVGAQDTVADDALFGPEQIPQPREDDLFAFDFFATSPAQLVVTAPASLATPVMPLLNHSTTNDAAPLAADDLDLAEPMPAGDGEQLLLGGAGTQIVIGEENGMCLVGGFV